MEKPIACDILDKVEIHFKDIADLIVGESFTPLLFNKYNEKIMKSLNDINFLLDFFVSHYPLTRNGQITRERSKITNSECIINRINDFRMNYNFDTVELIESECEGWNELIITIIRYYSNFLMVESKKKMILIFNLLPLKDFYIIIYRNYLFFSIL